MTFVYRYMGMSVSISPSMKEECNKFDPIRLSDFNCM